MKAIFLPIIAMTITLGACAGSKSAVEADSVVGAAQQPGALGREPQSAVRPSAFIPRAVIYKTNGDYSRHVAVVVTPDGKDLVTFPDPSDVGPQSEPLAVADGWLLERRGGIGPNTRFLTYTYDEYHALPSVPSVQTLLSAIIPEARVTAAYRLPVAMRAATPAVVDSIITTSLSTATPLIP